MKNKYNLEFLHPPQIIKPSMTFTAQVKTDKNNSSVTLQYIFATNWVNYKVMFHPKIKIKNYIILKNELYFLGKLRMIVL